jgi:hypothetical protein
MNAFKRLALAALAAPLLSIAPAQASGPLASCSDGVPYLWANGGQNIVWNADLGELGTLTKAEADEFVRTSFAEWQNVASSTISFVQGPNLPVDVDETNFVPYLEATEPDGLSAIVYDDTGAIFELLYGPDSGVLGFAGPEFGDAPTCTITEGLSFLNGPEFTDPQGALSVMVHEFGHFSNLGHSQTNGGILLGLAVGTPEPSGPAPNDTFGVPTVADFFNNGYLETMYPFYFGPGLGEEHLHADDIRSISRLYPAADYFATSASVAGSILAPNGSTRLSGVNVIARNVANPFLDAVSAISGDFTDETDPATSAVVGTYRFTGLTPGAQYAVFVDQILEGGFSTPPRSLPGPEEFHSGAAESNSDPTGTYVAVSAAAGATRSAVNVIFNSLPPGTPLPVGDDGFVEVFPRFPIDFCGERFSSLFINANGSITFGGASAAFAESTLAHLSGPPRIAGLWDDLNVSETGGGTVTFEESWNSITVRWQAVPEFPAVGANTFSITINRKNLLGEFLGSVAGNPFSISYGSLSAADGLSGYSCGSKHTSGFEAESDLSAFRGSFGGPISVPAVFEDLLGNSPGETVDLRGTLRFNGVNRIVDLTEIRSNDTIARATPLHRLPFDSANPAFATVIEPEDVDYYSFRVKAGDILAVEVVRGDLDSVIGIFDADTGELLVADDDGGDGLLSRLVVQVPVDLRLAVAVSTYPDVTFIGAGEESGRYSLYVNKYRGTPIAVGDDSATPVALGRPFRFQGANYSSVFVNSNGSLTFGAGDTSFDGNVPDFLAGPPRIAPLWTDLDPTGFLGNPGVVVVDANARPAAVHYISVSEFFSSTPNYFTAELGEQGKVALKWGPTARGAALVGTTQGGGATDPGETDLSRRGLRGNGTTYEEFLFNDSTRGVSDFDLFFEEVRNK